MNFKKLVRIALVSFSLVGLLGCQKDADKMSGLTGKSIATPDYNKFFGVPPVADKGTTYPFVIYFPSAKEQGKVVPFPFFTFDESSAMKVSVERLLGGMELGSYQGEFAPIRCGVDYLSTPLHLSSPSNALPLKGALPSTCL